ncbi:hypothetical protein [Pseudomonas aeruginosa]|uniref:hypothetical protein n=1 Tax=Pseudomonas aeruginosa TaxID=287 RepID=UPI00053E5818|nr:hypothetical protein [Pseudomonas aeruginosa]
MAKPYPILPLSVLDDMTTLNSTLFAYQFAIEAIIRRICTEGAPSDFESLLAGLDDMYRPILEGYQSVADQAKQFRDMGVVGFSTLGDTDQ